MKTEEITMILSRHLPDAEKVIFVVTLRDVLRSIADNLGENALSLTVSELLSAGNEVTVAFAHNLDVRELMTLGLEAWKITRSL